MSSKARNTLDDVETLKISLSRALGFLLVAFLTIGILFPLANPQAETKRWYEGPLIDAHAHPVQRSTDWMLKTIWINKALNLLGAGAATTIIDGGKRTTPSEGMVLITGFGTTGSVLVQGFTFQNPGPDTNYGYIESLTVGSWPGHVMAPIVVQYCHFIGYGPSDPNRWDMGLYVAYTWPGGTVTIQNNVFELMWQGVLLEVPRGGVSVVNNIFHDLQPALDSGTLYEPEGVFAFTYGTGMDVSALLALNGNTFFGFNGAPLCVGGGYPGEQMAKFTNVEIKNNIVNAIGSGPERKHIGIELINYAPNSGQADAGGVHNVMISGNTLGPPGGADSYGIRVRGKNTNVLIQNNGITGLDKGIATDEKYTGAGYPSGVVAHFNNIAGNTIGVSNGWTDPANLVNAENNWWGSATGPTHGSNPGGTGDAVSDNVDFVPWLGFPYGPNILVWGDGTSGVYERW